MGKNTAEGRHLWWDPSDESCSAFTCSFSCPAFSVVWKLNEIADGDICQQHKAWQNGKDEGRHMGMNLRITWVTLSKWLNLPNTKLDQKTMNSDYYKRTLS